MKIDSENLILFHPGKTGGTSIEFTLKDLYLPDIHLNFHDSNFDIMFGFNKQYYIYLQHADTRFYNMLGIDYTKYKTICTVRRPYERILSCYYYNNKFAVYSFEEFIYKDLEKSINHNNKYSTNHFSPQHYYTTNVKHIIKLENFKEDCQNLGLDIKYHFSQTHKAREYNNPMDAYNNKMKDIVYSLYKEDFKLLGYSQ